MAGDPRVLSQFVSSTEKRNKEGRQSALFVKPGSRLESALLPLFSLLSRRLIWMTEMVTDKDQSIFFFFFCKLLKAYRLATEEMVTQIMNVYLHFLLGL